MGTTSVEVDYNFFSNEDYNNGSSILGIGKVFGGKAASPGDFPFIISLQKADLGGKFNQHCGATIIHPLILLTAAHCLLNLQASTLKAVSGEQNLQIFSPNEQERNIIKPITHPRYNETTQENDIALLLLDRPLTFDKFTKPIRMAAAKPTVTHKSTIMGWGKTGKRSASPILQHATIKIFSLEECLLKWTQGKITENHICAGGPKDVCKGDSGGPLICYSNSGERYICGIVSWGGDECKSTAFPGVYTNVSAYSEWITESVQELLRVSQAVHHSPIDRGCGLSTSFKSGMFCATCNMNNKEAEMPFVAQYNVRMDIKNRYSSTQVSAVMFNPDKKNPKEVTFSLLFPQSALISGFTMTVDGIATNACTQEVESGGGNAIVQAQGQQQQLGNPVAGGILESSVPNFNRFNFTTTIGSLTLVNFTVTYEELLVRRRGIYKQEIHIDPQVVLEAQNCHVVVTISDSGAIRGLRTFGNDRTNEVTDSIEKQWDETSGTISWRPVPSLNTGRGPQTSHRLELQFDFGENEAEEAGRIVIQDDHFVHFLPSRHMETFQMPPKHFVFVLDTSSSMSGEKWTNVSAGMNTMLEDLNRNHGRDFFNIIAFDQSVNVWKGKSLSPIPVTGGLIKQAQNFIRLLKVKDAGGDDGWDLQAALQTALKISSFSNTGAGTAAVAKSPVIILLTSSSNNSSSNNINGITDTDDIQSEIAALNKDQQVPIFSIALFDDDHDGNSKLNVFPFLRKLSTQNNGMAVKIPLRSDTVTQLKDSYLEITSIFPLPKLNFTYSYPCTYNLTEPAMTNKFSSYIYKGSDVVVAGKISPVEASGGNLTSSPITLCNSSSESSSDSIRVVITANPVSTQCFKDFSTSVSIPADNKDSNSNNTVTSTIAPVPAPLPPSSNTVSFVPRIWAYLKVKELLEEVEKLMTISDGDADVEEITEYAKTLAVDHGFLTPLTSYVVTELGGKTVTLEDQVNGVTVFQAGTNGTGSATFAATSLIHINTSEYCPE